ncbi:MAG TPA: DUF2062 domain-containing protein [Chromatiales bacterium]|nr:DUF2062 domain-containing protein [Thiotrichales bacterium]HIP67969.1 DUF2062 domain-containing protein [Chromatiales bacterium]
MPRRFIKKFLPPPHRFREEPMLKKVFGKLLHETNLWHLNRRSVTVAVAIGLFFAFIPIPLQMVAAAVFAIWLKANLPIAVSLVWITNPITLAPIFIFAYQLGHWLLGLPPSDLHFELSFSWLMKEIDRVWKPLFLGSSILAVMASSVGYTATNILWRMHVVKRWKARRWRKKKRAH